MATRRSRSRSASSRARWAARRAVRASTGEHEAVELRDGDATAWLGKGVGRAVAHVNGELTDLLVGFAADDQRALDAALVELDGHARQEPLGANADPRLLAGRGEGGRRRARRRLALSLDRRHERAVAARADAERDQRRRACPEPPRPAGVHGRAGRRGELLGSAADRRRDLPPPEGRARTSAASRPASATRAASRPTSSRAWLRSRRSSRPQSGPATPNGSAIALDPAASEFFRDGSYRLDGEGRARPGGMVDFYADLAERFPLLSVEDGLAEDALDDWRTLDRALGTACSWSATTSSSRTSSGCGTGSRPGSRQRDPREGQSDRHAQRDARRDRSSPSAPRTPR